MTEELRALLPQNPSIGEDIEFYYDGLFFRVRVDYDEWCPHDEFYGTYTDRRPSEYFFDRKYGIFVGESHEHIRKFDTKEEAIAFEREKENEFDGDYFEVEEDGWEDEEEESGKFYVVYHEYEILAEDLLLGNWGYRQYRYVEPYITDWSPEAIRVEYEGNDPNNPRTELLEQYGSYRNAAIQQAVFAYNILMEFAAQDRFYVTIGVQVYQDADYSNLLGADSLGCVEYHYTPPYRRARGDENPVEEAMYEVVNEGMAAAQEALQSSVWAPENALIAYVLNQLRRVCGFTTRLTTENVLGEAVLRPVPHEVFHVEMGGVCFEDYELQQGVQSEIIEPLQVALPVPRSVLSQLESITLIQILINSFELPGEIADSLLDEIAGFEFVENEGGPPHLILYIVDVSRRDDNPWQIFRFRVNAEVWGDYSRLERSREIKDLIEEDDLWEYMYPMSLPGYPPQKPRVIKKPIEDYQTSRIRKKKRRKK